MILIENFISSAADQISLLRIADVIDILLVAVMVYFVLKFIRDSHTVRLLKGVIMIIIAVQVVYLLNLHVTSYILRNCAQISVIALVVIFQPELRRVLDQIGKTRMSSWFSSDSGSAQKTIEVIGEVAAAAYDMSRTRTGALIVIEQDADVNSLISGGINIDSSVTSALLKNIFVPNTPLHDGAVIIRDNRIALAACVLPLSNNPNITNDLGTRHRAGLGISEESDVAVVIVSEETGIISIAHKGVLYRGLNEESVKTRLTEMLRVNPQDKKRRSIRSIIDRKER